MGTVDAKTKEYVRNTTVFADIFNFLIYDGKSVIKPENLHERDTVEIGLPYGSDEKVSPSQKYRDVLKNAVIMSDENTAYLLILGVENQTEIHYAMPVKNMVYDALNYAAQISGISAANKAAKEKRSRAEYLSGVKKTDRIIPVITLTLYFGLDVWDAPLSLHEMLSVKDEAILRFVPDYRINLVQPANMTEADINKFTSDFRELSLVLRSAKDKDALLNTVQSDPKFTAVARLTADLMNVLTGANMNFDDDGKETVDVCKAIVDMRNEAQETGRAEGIEKGRAEGIEKGRAEGVAKGEDMFANLMQNLLAAGRTEDAMKASFDKEYRAKLYKEFSIKS